MRRILLLIALAVGCSADASRDSDEAPAITFPPPPFVLPYDYPDPAGVFTETVVVPPAE